MKCNEIPERKLFIALVLIFSWSVLETYSVQAQQLDTVLFDTPDSLQPETYRLWAGPAPGALGDSAADIPVITLYRPFEGRANGTAVVIAPGGGYLGLASTLEGSEPAMWFTSRGITAFVLTYRVGNAARLPTVLLDGARAVRFVRYHAEELGIDPNRVGMMGFSAGGHLAASTALNMVGELERPADAMDQLGAQPDFLILGYPWLETTMIRDDGGSAYCDFADFADIPCQPADYTEFLPLDYVTENTPPTFIFHTTDDELVPVAGSMRFYMALSEKGVDVEIHAFRSGPHGVGLGGEDPALSKWPELLEQWLNARDLIGE